MVSVRAIYRDGQLKILDPVDLTEGQEVRIHILDTTISVRELVQDMLMSVDFDTDDVDEEAIMEDLDQALNGQRPLSDIIIEERREGR